MFYILAFQFFSFWIHSRTNVILSDSRTNVILSEEECNIFSFLKGNYFVFNQDERGKENKF